MALEVVPFHRSRDPEHILATINLPTKFELSRPLSPFSTHCEDMKSDSKYRKWGGLGVVRGRSK